jgi:hypothetical protein
MLYFSTSTAATGSNGIYFDIHKYTEYKPHQCTRIVEEGCFCIVCGTKANLDTGNRKDGHYDAKERGIKY